MTGPALHRLLAGAVDYAGVFPPAALPLEQSARNYAEYRLGPDRWALGRFMLAPHHLAPLAALLPLSDISAGAPSAPGPWPLGLTLGPDLQAGLHANREFEAQVPAALARVTGAEARAATVAEVDRTVAALPDHWDRFIELPLDQDPAPLIDALAARATGPRSPLLGAKFRTGSVEASGFPAPDHLLRALALVMAAGIPFKCTAGLHHPVRGRYRLSYAPDSPTGMMYGYLNVFLAAALLGAGHPADVVRPVLLEEDPTAFVLGPDRVGWRHLTLDEAAVLRFRAGGLQGFGSCSFREPVDELPR